MDFLINSEKCRRLRILGMFTPDTEYSLNWIASSLSAFALDCYSRLNPVYHWSWFQSRMMRGDVHMRACACIEREDGKDKSLQQCA